MMVIVMMIMIIKMNYDDKFESHIGLVVSDFHTLLFAVSVLAYRK
jgi:hypothetical protein